MSSSRLSAVSSDTVATVSCPQCGSDVPWTAESTYRPFCSKRCRLIDLGDWLDEAHQIPGDPVWIDPEQMDDANGEER